MSLKQKIILPGGAGLVGQNLVIQMKQQGYSHIIVIDKHQHNLEVLKKLHPDIECIEDDLSKPGKWRNHFKSASAVVMLQAQIGSKTSNAFVENNINSTRLVLEVAKQEHVDFIVHISSSVVESIADDDYTNTKKYQEKLVSESGIKHCILRPTLMFGWFDRKHLGWLARFMKRIPIFPIPGNGCYMRQPLYAKDFCQIIIHCLGNKPLGKTYNITGFEHINYIDIIRTIKKVQGSHTLILKIPYSLFWMLLKVYAFFSKHPPFTTDQLKALTGCDEFELIPWQELFQTTATPFKQAIHDTFCDDRYSHITLEF